MKKFFMMNINLNEKFSRKLNWVKSSQSAFEAFENFWGLLISFRVSNFVAFDLINCTSKLKHFESNPIEFWLKITSFNICLNFDDWISNVVQTIEIDVFSLIKVW